VKIDRRLSLFIMGEEHREATKTQLALALAQGVTVTRWARENNVPRPTVYRWARDPKIRNAIESCRRRTLDRAIGMMVKRAPWTVGEITTLAGQAESESVRLRALKTIFSEMMAVSKYSGLESRMANIEERLSERAGNAGRQG
jgi:hypothetical protein